MHVIDAAAQTVDNYPGGAESLAPRMGMSAGILRNKVNSNNTTNHLTLEEADRMMDRTGDFQILQALAGRHGFALVPLEDRTEAGSVIGHILQLGSREGEFARVLHDALADGVISDREMNDIAAAGYATQSTLISLVRRLADMRRANAPAGRD